MEDNWYEAAVTAHHPHKIVSVVDWASDASDDHIAPVPKKPVKSKWEGEDEEGDGPVVRLKCL